jgi:hypothetical protein
MSYSLEQDCYQCVKQPECSDGEIIQGAINTIHQIGSGKGHQGAGNVKLECSYFEPEPDH